MLAKLLIVLCVAAVAALSVAYWRDLDSIVAAIRASAVGHAFFIVGVVILIINALAFIWQIALVLMYRPAATAAADQLPTLTVVVPAYNEGQGVVATLRSILACDYPAGKLQVIAVDDGSRDDTWEWMQKAAAEFPDRITTLRLEHNQGKRFALAAGFRRATGEVIVTVDSDSILDPHALRKIVSPLVADPRAAAVAGNIRVLAAQGSLIGRMLDVNFTYSFDFIRSSQSEVAAVMCIPGALAAYRRDELMAVLDGWLAQTFMGRPANIGEDRALTNLLLRRGGLCLFQADAICYTAVPPRYGGLCRMLIRWGRSNVRETLSMARFIFTRFRPEPKTGARINLVTQMLGLFITPPITMLGLACMALAPGMYIVHVLLATALSSTVPAVFYWLRTGSSNGLWAFPYGVFWLLGLSWINFYCLLTPQKSGWLTRQLP